MTQTPSYEEIAARLLQPAAPCAAQAKALAASRATAAELWEAMEIAGLTPPPRAGERRFRAVTVAPCESCRGKGRTGGYSGDPDEWEDDAWTCGTCDSQGHTVASERDHDRPASVEECVALASDPEGVRTVEALADEAAARLAVLGAPAQEELVWRVGGPLPRRRVLEAADVPWLQRMVTDPSLKIWASPAVKPFEDKVYDVGTGAFFDRARLHVQGDQFWRQALERGERVPDEVKASYGPPIATPRALVGRAFAELANPFAPTLEIWARGYVPVRLTGTVVLWRSAIPEAQAGRSESPSSWVERALRVFRK